jgi:hypothetical protein
MLGITPEVLRELRRMILPHRHRSGLERMDAAGQVDLNPGLGMDENGLRVTFLPQECLLSQWTGAKIAAETEFMRMVLHALRRTARHALSAHPTALGWARRERRCRCLRG